MGIREAWPYGLGVQNKDHTTLDAMFEELDKEGGGALFVEDIKKVRSPPMWKAARTPGLATTKSRPRA